MRYGNFADSWGSYGKHRMKSRWALAAGGILLILAIAVILFYVTVYAKPLYPPVPRDAMDRIEEAIENALKTVKLYRSRVSF